MRRLLGFSTGALAFGAYNRGLAEVRLHALEAVELSALRQPELEPLINAIDDLDLSGFQHIAFHAPSEITAGTERLVVEMLLRVAERCWPIIVHPDVIVDYSLWSQLGRALCIENMTSENLSEGRRTNSNRCSSFSQRLACALISDTLGRLTVQ